MSYRKPREWHGLNILPILMGSRYAVCARPGCSRVRRAWWAKPLIHKGRKP